MFEDFLCDQNCGHERVLGAFNGFQRVDHEIGFDDFQGLESDSGDETRKRSDEQTMILV
jgi:hypothetical protein